MQVARELDSIQKFNYFVVSALSMGVIEIRIMAMGGLDEKYLQFNVLYPEHGKQNQVRAKSDTLL